MAENEKCFCHFNGYQVKDATARKKLEECAVLKKGSGVDSVAQVITTESGEPSRDNKPVASGQSSVALGRFTAASGNCAMAVNYDTDATGDHSFAANVNTEAVGEASFSANKDNHAMGDASFAIGRSSYAGGENSISTGLITSAKGKNSATFGEGTRTGEDAETDPDSGINAVAMGKNTRANGKNAVAIGYLNYANGVNSFAGGSGSSATGQSDFAFGFENKASGGGSVAFGKGTSAKASYSFAGGDTTEVNERAYYSIAYGKGLKSTGEAQAIFGKFNMPMQNVVFAVGNGTSDEDRKNVFYITSDGRMYLGAQNLSTERISEIMLHLENKNNPHKITPEQIGAATTAQMQDAYDLAQDAYDLAGEAKQIATNATQNLEANYYNKNQVDEKRGLVRYHDSGKVNKTTFTTVLGDVKLLTVTVGKGSTAYTATIECASIGNELDSEGNPYTDTFWLPFEDSVLSVKKDIDSSLTISVSGGAAIWNWCAYK